MRRTDEGICMQKYTRFHVNKLIRDNIPNILNQEPGYKSVTKTLNDTEFIDCLKEKLIEEALEVKTSQDKKNFIEEMGDVLEVFYTLLKNNQVTLEEVEKVRENQRRL
ncbi:phosphoribosyl-ATP pyrophosphohydrolase [Candidatus Dependentiae bacterium]|nr:phosphoribosyl-ATP pyrophosphohydrolase [Candidatus Dependentiae bacterium]